MTNRVDYAVLGRKVFKAGYIVETRRVMSSDCCPEFCMKVALTPGGLYIGDTKTAYRLCNKLGIQPELAKATDNVCSIGFSARSNRWFGWSHRAIFGFTIGDMVKEGDCCASSGSIPEYLVEHPEVDLSLPVGFVAKTMEDTKRMAIAFADSVG